MSRIIIVQWQIQGDAGDAVASPLPEHVCDAHACEVKTNAAIAIRDDEKRNKKAQLSLTNPRDACEKFARFT